MSKTMIAKMAERFLRWKLPKDFCPDAGITFNPGHITPSSPIWPVGTNLLTACQAQEMIKHMLVDAMPPGTYSTEEEGNAYMHGYFDGMDAAAQKINAG